MTITIGSWGIPILITIALLFVLLWRYQRAKRYDSSGFMGDISSTFTGLFWIVVTIIVSLVAWLIWALNR